MTHYIKAHPIKFAIFMVLVLLSLRVLVWGGLNMTGFCWAEKRWLSDEEKIVKAIDIDNSISYVRIDTPVNGGVSLESFDRISYKDANDLITQNPNCCRIERRKPKSYPDNKLGRLFAGSFTGDDSGDDISINYNAKYRDQKGTEKSLHNKFTRALMNCGGDPN